jgi:hypothetical protein
MKLLLNAIGLCMLLIVDVFAIQDPVSPDTLRLQDIEIKAGKSGVMTISIVADDTTVFNDQTWRGIGSFCIPLKYEKAIMKVDSVKFEGNVAKWDEKFCNTKIDTGFVSLAGIYNLGGAENPALYSPGKSEVIASIYLTAAKDAPAGQYRVVLTHDPIQKEIYCGSTDGYNSWKPIFLSGKIRIR